MIHMSNVSFSLRQLSRIRGGVYKVFVIDFILFIHSARECSNTYVLRSVFRHFDNPRSKKEVNKGECSEIAALRKRIIVLLLVTRQ